MSAVMKFDESRGDPMSGGGEGGMNDVLKRLGAVETTVATIAATLPYLAKQSTVDSLAATMPHLAKQSTVDSLAATIPHLAKQSVVDGILSTLPHLATKADLFAMESKIIKWIIATVLTTAGLTSSLAFAIAKFVH